MALREQIKDDYSETRLIQRRLIVAALIVLLLMSLVLGRLYVLQVVDHEHFSTLSNSNRVRIKALPPTRGLIYDRNGVVLGAASARLLADLLLERPPILPPDAYSLERVVEIAP